MLVFNMRLTAQQKKNLYYLVPLVVLLIGTFLFYLLAVRVRPNDKILTNSEGVALFANENPTFEVQFGDKENPDGQWIRFEARTSNDNPFSSEEKRNIFTQIASIFAPKKKSGIEMSLRGVDFSETKTEEKTQQDEQIQKVADILRTEEIKTSTVLTEMGREIGENEGDQIISKQTIVNHGVAEGIDLEYQVLKGLGLKEEIVINDLEAYTKSCDDGCKLPLNEFVFDLKVDDGVVLKKGWFTVEGKSSEMYYFVDGNGKYLAHFLPSYAVDDSGNKTYEVDLKIDEVKAGNYEAKVTVSSEWLLDPNRVYPIRIDPSIVHDDTTDFSGGIFNRTESVTGPKIQIKKVCSGGTITTNGDYTIHTFTSGGTFVCPVDTEVEYLVVAGGGGAGSGVDTTHSAGGGGAGGVLSGTGYHVSGSATVTVGNGGAGGAAGAEHAGTNGQNSVFGTFTAIGGGYGATTNGNGASGGSGGGGGANGGVTTTGGSGTSGQGYSGGNGAVGNPGGSGGGGGAGGAGANNSAGSGGNGGVGISSTITGSSVLYAGGGGGARQTSGTNGSGGSGIGGNGNDAGAGGDAVAYTGSGGGGGGTGRGGNGSSGIVIVRYKSKYVWSEYISSSLNLGSAVSGMTMSWLASGVNTGNGETPYSTTGMVAQWNFNETSGTTAVSGGTCGTSCNGTLTNMTTTGQDAAPTTGWTANNRRWGSGAVMFDGTNDNVIAGSESSFDFERTSAFSIEAWIKTSSTVGGAIVSKLSSSAPYTGYELWTDASGYIGFMLNNTWSTNTLSIYSPVKVNDGTWHHIVVVYTGTSNPSGMSVYIDGKTQTTTTTQNSLTSSVLNNISLNIGSRNNAGSFFNGIIDSTRVYSRALSANEILSNYQSGNIEFQYRTSTDNSTWSNWTSYNDGALMLDGNDDYVNVGDIAAVDALTSFSTCAWINNDTLTSDAQIFSKVDSTSWTGIMFLKDIVGQVSGRTNMYKIWVSQNTNAAFIEGATNSATTGAWQQVCATFTANSATGLHLYVNGVEDANSPVSTVGITNIDSGTNILTMGKYAPASTSLMDGSIDNLQLYNRVLSGAEIISNYNVSDFETPYSSTGLLAHWKFNELSGTTAVSGGTCGVACNGTLTNFSSTTGRDSSTTSGWTAKTKLGSDYPEYSFDSQYLYKTDDTGLIAYWPMDEASGSGAYLKDVATTPIPFGTGGTVTYSGGYTIHTFTSGGTFTASQSGTVEVLVVAGGGGGGTAAATGGGGGGGAGGVLYSASTSISAGNNPVIVGSGGNANASGGNSSFLSLTALGGGYGGNASGTLGGNGGSGGGSASGNVSRSSGTSGQGYAGGIGNASISYGAGGGGGASGQGSDGTTGGGSNGGNGVSNSITGTVVTYGGGGGGSFGQYGNPTIPNGGTGGGGAGGYNSVPAGVAGTANTGGGGGGGWNGSAGASGGSGIVVIRYPTANAGGVTSEDATPVGASYVNGKSGSARGFNGSNNYIEVPSSGVFDVTNLTIESWVYSANFNQNGFIFEKGSVNTQYSCFFAATDTFYFRTYNTAATVDNLTFTTSAYVKNNAWNHIACTYDGSYKKVYVNGILAASAAYTQTLRVGQAGERIGAYGGTASYFFNGVIDEVRIFNTALSAATIASDYIKGITNKGSTVSQRVSSFREEGTGAMRLSSGAYTVDSSTVGLWHLDEQSGTGAYLKDSVVNPIPFATGGTISYSVGYITHTFTSGGTFVANGTGNVEVLAVAGGGGGGTASAMGGGGGGGGGVLYSSSVSVSAGSNTVVVGNGGAANTSGGNSSFLTVTAIGGGYGGNATNATGANGGSGGGSRSGTVSRSSGTAGQGSAGGIGNSNSTYGAGGGGGASGQGSDGITGGGSYGGNGVLNSISGTFTYYGGGGGGSFGANGNPSIPNGGVGGGGAGGYNSVPAGVAGTANTGGGGGGGWNGSAGASGGSGIVIIRYPSTYTGGTISNNATPTGTTYTNAGKVGGARSLNGTTDMIDLPAGVGLASQGTIEMWFKTNVTNDKDYLYTNAASGNEEIRFMIFNNTLYIDGYDNGAYQFQFSPAFTDTTQWHHVALAFGTNDARMYLDGVQVASDTTVSMAISAFNNLAIGNQDGGSDAAGSGFNGYVDEVRISNIARTANEIAESYKLGKDSYINQTLNTINLSTKNTMAINVASDRPGTYLSATWGESAFANYQPDINTVGLWHMDEISGSGAYTKDVSGSNNNGTPTGTTYTGSGKLGGARSFNGSSDYISAARNTSINTTFDGSYSVSMWFNSNSTATIKRMWGLLDASSGYHIAMLNYPSVGKIKFYGGAGTDADALDTARANLNDGQWHYAVFQIDGTTQRIYIDGILDASKTRVAGTASDENFYVGKSNNATSSAEHFAGNIDEVHIDNIARTADQIRQAYEVGLRTHNITVTFGAGLGSGNLITGSGDYSFNIDATKYGLSSLGSELFTGDKVIVKENYNGTEYIAQGTVSTVNLSTGAVAVSSWDSGSTFPSGGFTVNADVFKWQKEYIPVKNRTISTQVDATNLLTFRLNDGNEGRNIWIDDLRSSPGYLKNSSSEVISFANNAQYVQYKTIFTSWDSNVTPYISQVQIDYTGSGPTIDQLMKHGMWFDSSGAKKSFWWVGTH
jgi:hypothetical protein